MTGTRKRVFDHELSADAAERVSAGAYGYLVAAATLIGIGDRPLWTVIVIVVTTNLVYFATHVFAYTIGPQPHAKGEELSSTSLGATVRHHLAVSAPILSAAFLPLAVVLLLVVLGVDQQTATLFAVATAAFLLTSIATGSIYLRGVRGWRLVLVAVVTLALMSVLVIAKLVLFH
ncbi:hypothetical protein [Compostimonas suwonensis]|uniref:Uncharacterized protein n=1 Tax=Compostimonas suwonensis TaxID=1048394 RepID=A0A2M9BB74_9MICO|nr:hypothetical protein [Compostimonas suwonensis]PJJ55194.1 hypothetical protein CLV54_3330 [Compostimonas suwonensis]